MNDSNDIRLERFRQFKAEVRGSREYMLVGIDVGKDKHNACFGSATGETLLRGLVFDNDIQGCEKLVDNANSLRLQNGLTQLAFGLEPTGNYHKPLAEFLIVNGGGIVVSVSANAVAKNRELLDGRWDKHDTKDAANIADLMAQGKCLFYDMPRTPIRDLRALLSLRRRLKKQEQGTKVRIRNSLIALYFPEFDRFFGTCEKESLAIVRWCLNPSIIARMDYEEFVSVVTTKRGGIRQHNRLTAIWEKAVQSIGCRAGESLEFEAAMMVKQLDQIRECIRETDDKIANICLEFPEYTYLLTIPGFGPVLSSRVLGAIGNPHRFNSAKEVLKLAGLDLSASRSGKPAQTAVPVLSKKGKGELRYALYQAALVASVRNRDFMIYFINQLRGRERERGIKTKMRVKLSAKLLVIAWTLMKKREAFDPLYLNQV